MLKFIKLLPPLPNFGFPAIFLTSLRQRHSDSLETDFLNSSSAGLADNFVTARNSR